METLHEDRGNTQNKKSWAERILGSMPSFRQHIKQTAKDEQATNGFVEDERTPQGDPIRVEIGAGQTLEQIAPQLERLKSAGKRAFVEINGQRWDNYSQEYKIPDYTELRDKKEALGDLDYMPDIKCYDKYNLVGVVSSIKPAMEFNIFVQNGDKKKESNVDAILNELGLKYVKESEPYQPDPSYTGIEYHVAKTTNTAKRAQELMKKSQDEGQTGDATRELGQLFGYPKTAVEFFIKRAKGEVPMDSARRGTYSSFIHSPDNFEEECRQYDLKIDYPFEKYCPYSAFKYRKLNEEIENKPSR